MAKPCSGVAGSSTGTFAKEPNPARVLLGLGGDGARIVGHEQHAAAARAHVVQRHERIGSDIEPHLLAGEQHPRAAVGRAGPASRPPPSRWWTIPHARPGPRPPRAASPRFPPAPTTACPDSPPPRSHQLPKPRGQTPRFPSEVSSPYSFRHSRQPVGTTCPLASA